MKKAEDSTRYFFVDESGSPDFYAKRSKRLIVGEEGCSNTFSVASLRTRDPQAIRAKIAELRIELSESKYLAAVPSVKDSLLAFHAKNDCMEVRKMVFEAMVKMDFRVQVIVARKHEEIFVKRHGCSTHKFYDDLVTRLFFNQLHLAKQNEIVFARRGTKSRQHALRTAVELAASHFRAKASRFTRPEDPQIVLNVETSQPIQEPVLQIVDYMLWAIQRAFEKNEMRYFDFVRDKIELVRDVYDLEKKERNEKTVYDRRKNTFHVDKITGVKKEKPVTLS